jgi:transposase
LALVALSVVEQRLDAVRAVLSGAKVTEVAAAMGVSRQSVHSWVTRYLAEGLAGLADRSHRPGSCPHQVAGEVEVVVAEMRRQHPKWGAKRMRLELLRRPPAVPVPSERTINRIFARQGLALPRPRRRPRDSYRRWQRPGPMQLWQIDIVGGVMIADPRTGELREAKIVAGVDDHSRVLRDRRGHRAGHRPGRVPGPGRRPGQVRGARGDLDRQRQAVHRPVRQGRGGAVRQDLPQERDHSPSDRAGVTGHHRQGRAVPPDAAPRTARRPCLRPEARAALDAWVAEYNADRPHQALDGRSPVTPADRFTPVPPAQKELIDVWLPPALTLASSTGSPAQPAGPGSPSPAGCWPGGPVEFDRVVPPSGNMWVAGRQFWLGPARAGTVIRFWADTQLIHLSAGGARIKTLRSHLSVSDLAQLAATGAVPAGPVPLPPAGDGQAIEVERPVSRGGLVCLGPTGCWPRRSSAGSWPASASSRAS